jgi:hypothetical protein
MTHAELRVGSRQAREIDPRCFPLEGPLRAQLAFLLRYAVLAPSTHNTQPWWFAVRGDSIAVHPDRRRWLRVADPDRREMFISLGCAVENLVTAGSHFGFTARVEYGGETDADPAAVVWFAPGRVAGRGQALFDALTRRRTPRGPFEPRALPLHVLRELQGCCEGLDGVELWLVTDRDTRASVERLVRQADLSAYRDPAYRRELGRWIGAGAFGTGWVESALGHAAVAALDVSRGVARRDAALLGDAPAVGVLTSREDDHAAHVRVGRAYERIVLSASVFGIGVQPFSPIVEVAGTRRALAGLLPGAGAVQHVFRAGYLRGTGRVTPRRHAAEVVA